MTAPDVHRISTMRGPNATVILGYVDSDGVYHFPDGSSVHANGDAFTHDGIKTGSSVVVRADGSLQTYGLGPRDGGDPTANAARVKHSVDQRYQAVYDANPEDFTEPADVFAAVDGS